jgi:hypothetical protein
MRVTIAKRPSVWTLLLRYWITGRPLWGPGDNATFLRDATVDHRGGPAERLTRARWRRVARRWGIAGVPLALWAFVGLWALLVYLGTVTAVCVVLGVVYGRPWWAGREVRREFVYPVWQVASRILGERYSRRTAVRAVVLPAGFGQDASEAELSVRLHLPVVPLDEGQQKRLAAAVGDRLGMPDPAASWTIRGARAFVDITPKSFPPRALTYGEVRTLVVDASPSKPFVGLAAKRVPVYADLDNDGPHMGVSGGTGSGKSTLMRLVLARRVAAGVGVVVCDYKVISHPFLRRIAKEDPHRVVYAMDEEEISDAILAVFAEFSRRREILKTRPEELDMFREVDLVIEELNSLADMLRKWWGHERRRILAEAKANEEPTPYVPVVPEAVDALGVLVQAGRELRIHVHVVGQRLDASAISPRGGAAVRESISNRFLAGYTKATWNMLAAGIPYYAFPGGPRGIWVAAMHGTSIAFRVPPISTEEAYQLAMSGPAPAGPVLGGARLVGAREQAQLVTLGEAWELVGAPSLDALRKRVQREQLPALGRRGNADTFDMRDLMVLYRGVKA